MSISGEKRDHQNFFFLSCIQIASIGLAPLAVGNLLSTQYEPGVAICSILVGNLILWLIAIAIVSISNQNNSIQIIKLYIGNIGAWVVSAIFIVSMLDWFAFSIDSTVNSLKEFFSLTDAFPKNTFLRIGTALGVFTSLLALGGIRLLKWTSVITLPFLILFFIYELSQSKITIPPLHWGLSFPAVFMTIFSVLAGTLNLPTFFRHSTSRANSYLALTLITLFYMILECIAIWIPFKNPESGVLMKGMQNSLTHNNLIIAFILLVCLCNNLMNIYFASAFYETFSPRFSGMKGHAIMGLLGTATYAFVQISPPISFLLQLINAYILNLAAVLLIAVVLRVIIKHKSTEMEQKINSLAWVLGCVIATIAKIQNPADDFNFLFTGISSSAFFFLMIVFIKETLSAVRDYRVQRADK